MDLRAWDFEKNGSVDLSGEWTFFKNSLIAPGSITDTAGGHHVSVPGLWSRYPVDGLKMTPRGYATYHLVVHLPEGNPVLGLFCEGQGSAYALYVNGRLKGRNGVVGQDRQSMIPDKKPQTIFFKPDSRQINIVMQISNFHHRKGGFRNELLLGLSQPVHEFQMNNWFVEVFSIGLLFVMGFYHLFIFAFRTKNRPPLYFAMVCWLWAVRLVVLNQNTFLFIQPVLTWGAALKIEYFTFYIAPVVFCLFAQSLYPKDLHRLFKWVVVGLGLFFTGLLLFADTFFLSRTVTLYQVVIMIQIVYYLYFLSRIVMAKRQGAPYIAVAFIITFATVIVEALYFQDILLYGKIAHYGFLAFIFIQAILLASLLSKAFFRVKVLSGELEGVNRQLVESEKKYREIFDNSKDIIFTAGMDAQIRDVNPACKEILGYDKKEIQDKNRLDGILGSLVKSRLQSDLSDQGQFKNVELTLKRKDGKRIDALMSASYRYDNNGRPIGVQGSVRDITSRKQAETERMRAMEFKQIAITDPLTNIYNRRFFFEVLKKEISRAKRNTTFLSVILMDADYFKHINDQYGHLAGDQVLVGLADLCLKNLRKTDILARFGGEEFVVLMPETKAASSLKKADQLREMIAQKTMAVVEGEKLTLTVSMGIATFHPDNPITINDLLEQADLALYRSKEAGRNTVTAWEA